jgi:hypothetical protein
LVALPPLSPQPTESFKISGQGFLTLGLSRLERLGCLAGTIRLTLAGSKNLLPCALRLLTPKLSVARWKMFFVLAGALKLELVAAVNLYLTMTAKPALFGRNT